MKIPFKTFSLSSNLPKYNDLAPSNTVRWSNLSEELAGKFIAANYDASVKDFPASWSRGLFGATEANLEKLMDKHPMLFQKEAPDLLLRYGKSNSKTDTLLYLLKKKAKTAENLKHFADELLGQFGEANAPSFYSNEKWGADTVSFVMSAVARNNNLWQGMASFRKIFVRAEFLSSLSASLPTPTFIAEIGKNTVSLFNVLFALLSNESTYKNDSDLLSNRKTLVLALASFAENAGIKSAALKIVDSGLKANNALAKEVAKEVASAINGTLEIPENQIIPVQLNKPNPLLVTNPPRFIRIIGAVHSYAALMVSGDGKPYYHAINSKSSFDINDDGSLSARKGMVFVGEILDFEHFGIEPFDTNSVQTEVTFLKGKGNRKVTETKTPVKTSALQTVVEDVPFKAKALTENNMAVKNLFKKLNGNPIPEYRALDVLDDWLDDDFDANLLKKAAFSDNATLPKAWLAKLTDTALLQEPDQLTKVVRSAPNLALMYLRLNEKFQGEAMNAMHNNASQEEVVNFFKKAIDDTSNNNATALFLANPERSRPEFVGAMLVGFAFSENAMSNRTFVLKVFNNVKWASRFKGWANQNSSWLPFVKQKFDARYFMQTLGNMFAIGDVSIEAKKIWAEAAKILWEASPKKDDATFQKQAAHSLEVLVNTSGIDAGSVALANDLLGAIKGTSTSSAQDASPSTEVDVDSVFGFFLKHRAELAASLKKTSQKDRMATYMEMYQKSGTLIADAEAYVWANLISTTGKVHNHCVNVVAQADLQGSLKLSDLITSIKEATSSDVKMRGSAKVVKHLNIVFAVPSGQDAGHGKDNVVEFNKIGNFNALMLTATLDDGNQAIIPVHEVAAKLGLDDAAYFDAMMELGAILHKNQNKTQACLDQLATWLTQKLSPRGRASAVIQGDTETETAEASDGQSFVKQTNAAIKPLLSATDLHDFYAKCTELYPNIGEAYINYPFWVDDTEDAVIGVLQFSFELASKVEAADVYRMAEEAGVDMSVMASMPDYVFSGAGVFIDAKRYDNWKAVSKSKRSLNLIADGDFQVPLLKPAYQTDKVIDTLIAAAYDGGGDVSAVLAALAKLYPVKVAQPKPITPPAPPAPPAPSVTNDTQTIVPPTVEEAAKKVVAETVTQGDVIETPSGTSVVVDHDQTELEIMRQAFLDYGLTDLTELENTTIKRSFSQFAAFSIAMTGVLESFAFGFAVAQEQADTYPDFADSRVVYLFPPKSQHTEAIQVALETLLGDFLRAMHGAANKKNKRWSENDLMESLSNLPEQIIWNSYFSEPLPQMAKIDGELVDLGQYFDEQQKERVFGQAYLLLKDCTTTYTDVKGRELEVPFGQAICWTVHTCAVALANQYAAMPEDAFVTKAASVLASYVNKVPAPRVLSLIEYADAERAKQAASVDDLATGFNTPADSTPTDGMDAATFTNELATLQSAVAKDVFGALNVISHEDGNSPADTLDVLVLDADTTITDLLSASHLYAKVVEYGSFNTAIEEGYLSEEQVADVLRVLTKGEFDLTSDTNYVEPTEPTPPKEPLVDNTPTFQAPTTDTSTITDSDDKEGAMSSFDDDDAEDFVQPPVITQEAQDTLDDITNTIPVTNLTKPADENPKVEGIADELSIMASQYATKVKSTSSRVAAETPSRVALRENTTADTHMTFSGSKARFLTNVLRQIGGNSEVVDADTLNDILTDELSDSVDFYFYNNDSFSQWELSIAVQGQEVYKTSFEYGKSANAENVPIAYISLMLVLNNGGMRDVFLDGGDETYPKDYSARLMGSAFNKHTDLDAMLNEFMVGGGSTQTVTFDDDTSPSTDSTLDSELDATDYAARVFKEALANEAANVVTLDRIKAALTDVNDNSEDDDYTIRTREDLAAFITDSAAYAAGEATGIKDEDLLKGLFNGLAYSPLLIENDNTADRVKDFLATVVADEEDGYMDVAVSAMIDALGVYLEDEDDGDGEGDSGDVTNTSSSVSQPEPKQEPKPEPKQEPKPTSVDTNALVEKANELLAKLLSGVRTTQQQPVQQQPKQQQPQQQQTGADAKKSFSFKSPREGKTTTQKIDTSTLKDAKDTAQTQTKRAVFNSNVSANLNEVSAAITSEVSVFYKMINNVRSVIAKEANAKGIDFSALSDEMASSENPSENYLNAFTNQDSPMLFTQGIADLVLSPAVEKELERILGDSASAYRALSPADKVAEVAKALVASPSAEVSDWWF